MTYYACWGDSRFNTIHSAINPSFIWHYSISNSSASIEFKGLASGFTV